jgi:hypothetical protein
MKVKYRKGVKTVFNHHIEKSLPVFKIPHGLVVLVKSRTWPV